MNLKLISTVVFWLAAAFVGGLLVRFYLLTRELPAGI